MSLFASVKDSVTTLQAAKRYGLKVNRQGMCQCPFHDDLHPSMKVDRRFHCFGCQADGDVISFTSRLFHLTPGQAAQKLANDFDVQILDQHASAVPRTAREVSAKEVLTRQAAYCYRELCEDRDRLMQWRCQYAPESADEEPHPRFLDALRGLEMVEYQLDLLLSGTDADKEQVIRDYLQQEKERKEACNMEPMVKTPIYRQSSAYARAHGELEQFRQSHQANLDCRKDVEQIIARHFDGFRLDREAVSEVLERYGAERVALVLAATVQVREGDGRFSPANRDWAFTMDFPDTLDGLGFDRRCEYAVNTHSAVLNGFIDLFRKEIKTREQTADKGTAALSAEAMVPQAKPARRKTHSMER